MTIISMLVAEDRQQPMFLKFMFYNFQTHCFFSVVINLKMNSEYHEWLVNDNPEVNENEPGQCTENHFYFAFYNSEIGSLVDRIVTMLPNEMTRDEFKRELDNLGVISNEEYNLCSISFPTKMDAIEWSFEQ